MSFANVADDLSSIILYRMLECLVSALICCMEVHASNSITVCVSVGRFESSHDNKQQAYTVPTLSAVAPPERKSGPSKPK